MRGRVGGRISRRVEGRVGRRMRGRVRGYVGGRMRGRVGGRVGRRVGSRVGILSPLFTACRRLLIGGTGQLSLLQPCRGEGGGGLVCACGAMPSLAPSWWMRRQRWVWSPGMMPRCMTVAMAYVGLPGNGGSCNHMRLVGCRGGEGEGRATWSGTSFFTDSGQGRTD